MCNEGCIVGGEENQGVAGESVNLGVLKSGVLQCNRGFGGMKVKKNISLVSL